MTVVDVQKSGNEGTSVMEADSESKLLDPVFSGLYDYLKNNGFKIEHNESYRSLYGIDFIVNGVEGIHSGINLGVAIVRPKRDVKQREDFLRSIRKNVASRGLCIEVGASNLETGAKPVVYAAILGFLFSKEFAGGRNRNVCKYKGLKIFNDNIFTFFDIEESIRRNRQVIHNEISQKFQDEVLEGKVSAFFPDKGYGFIDCNETNTKFFFHVSDVIEEDSLAEKLREFTPEDRGMIEVSFEFGVSRGKKYPKAILIGCDPDPED